MGKRGPAPKPRHLKLLQGTHRSDREAPRAPDPDPLMLEPPGWLSRDVPWGRYALACWKRLAPVLARLHLTTDLDVESFAAWCDAWGRWRYFRRAVAMSGATQESDTGWRGQQPEIALMNRALEDLIKLGARFGWSPSDRTRVSAQLDQDDPRALEDAFFGAR